MKKIDNLTAIVVTFNEDKYLSECLNSLSFCDQLIVIDMGSVDSTVEIIKDHQAEIYFHDLAPIVEMILPYYINRSRNPWIIRADPDEIFPIALAKDVKCVLAHSKNIGIINLPHQYYFLEKPLKHTIWGGIKYIPKIFHRDRVQLNQLVHRSIQNKKDFDVISISNTGNNVIQHYWIDSINQLFEKHYRYIKLEGQSRYESGERFSFRYWFKETLKALIRNLLFDKGILGGLISIFLSFFYAWYINMSILSLRKYQNSLHK